MHRSGFSLLEILLSLAIFGGAMVVLSSLLDTGSLAAIEARDLSKAQMLCEAKLEESLLQNAVPISVPPSPLATNLLNQVWSYAIDVQPASSQGLYSIKVTVRAAAPGMETGKEASYSLVRWMIDPMLESELQSTQQSSESETGSGTSSSSSTGGTSQ
jgi:prepilin-type N-terminal cleavage/methylation domain-containing protein